MRRKRHTLDKKRVVSFMQECEWSDPRSKSQICEIELVGILADVVWWRRGGKKRMRSLLLRAGVAQASTAILKSWPGCRFPEKTSLCLRSVTIYTIQDNIQELLLADCARWPGLWSGLGGSVLVGQAGDGQGQFDCPMKPVPG